MKRSQAAKLVGMLAAYWPGTDIRDETAQLWEAEILDFELEDGMEAVRMCALSGRFMPSLADFIDAIREVRDDRLRTFHSALPEGQAPEYYPFTQYLADHPEMVPRVTALQGTWTGDMLAQLLRDEIAHGEAVRRRAGRR